MIALTIMGIQIDFIKLRFNLQWLYLDYAILLPKIGYQTLRQFITTGNFIIINRML
jgi:hypothetical protein